MRVLKATVRAFDAASYRATVQLDGSLATYLEGVPVSRGLPAGEVTAGRRAALLVFEGGDAGDGMVVGVW